MLGKTYEPPGLQRTIIFSGTMGGPNWGGASYDPVSHLLFVNSQDTAQIIRMVKGREGSRLPYVPAGDAFRRFWDSNHYPCQKPPWGTLTAIDLDQGTIRWQVPLGIVEELVAKGIPPTGTSNVGGSMVTAGGLVFIAATNDRHFRAFDKETGKELWDTKRSDKCRTRKCQYCRTHCRTKPACHPTVRVGLSRPATRRLADRWRRSS